MKDVLLCFVKVIIIGWLSGLAPLVQNKPFEPYYGSGNFYHPPAVSEAFQPSIPSVFEQEDFEPNSAMYRTENIQGPVLYNIENFQAEPSFYKEGIKSEPNFYQDSSRRHESIAYGGVEGVNQGSGFYRKETFQQMPSYLSGEQNLQKDNVQRGPILYVEETGQHRLPVYREENSAPFLVLPEPDCDNEEYKPQSTANYHGGAVSPPFGTQHFVRKPAMTMNTGVGLQSHRNEATPSTVTSDPCVNPEYFYIPPYKAPKRPQISGGTTTHTNKVIKLPPGMKGIIEPSKENYNTLRTVLRVPIAEPPSYAQQDNLMPTLIIKEEVSPSRPYHRGGDNSNEACDDDDEDADDEQPQPVVGFVLVNHPFRNFKPAKSSKGDSNEDDCDTDNSNTSNNKKTQMTFKSPITILPPRFPPRVEQIIEKIQNYFSYYNSEEHSRPTATPMTTGTIQASTATATAGATATTQNTPYQQNTAASTGSTAHFQTPMTMQKVQGTTTKKPSRGNSGDCDDCSESGSNDMKKPVKVNVSADHNSGCDDCSDSNSGTTSSPSSSSSHSFGGNRKPVKVTASSGNSECDDCSDSNSGTTPSSFSFGGNRKPATATASSGNSDCDDCSDSSTSKAQASATATTNVKSRSRN